MRSRTGGGGITRFRLAAAAIAFVCLAPALPSSAVMPWVGGKPSTQLVGVVNADGIRGDELVTLRTDERHAAVSVRRLENGAPLWTRRFGAAILDRNEPQFARAAALLADLNNDRRPEVVVATQDFEADDHATAPLLSVLDVRDGATIWSVRLERAFSACCPPAGPRVGAIAGTLDVRVAPMPDANGDGATDLLVQTWSVAKAAGTWVVTGVRMIRVYSGKTGSMLSAFPATGVYGPTAHALSWSPGDLTGDGRPDIVSIDKETPALAVYELTGKPAWIRNDFEFLEGTFAIQADRDPALELVVAGCRCALDGRTGETIWRLPATPYANWMRPMGDVDRDGIDDVFLDELRLKDNILAALSGSNGRVLWQRSFLRRLSGRRAQSVVSWMPVELTGDRSKDIPILLRVSKEFGEIQSESAGLIDGLSGRVRLTPLRKDERTSWLVGVGGDLDGSRAPDMLSVATAAGGVVIARILEGKTLRPIQTKRLRALTRFDDSPWVTASAVATGANGSRWVAMTLWWWILADGIDGRRETWVVGPRGATWRLL